MNVIQDITIDVSKPRQTVIHVVQEDSTRKIRLTLLKDNLPFNVQQDLTEETVYGFVEFRKADGHGGMYDTTSLGDPAVELEDAETASNVWIVSLDGNCFTCPGWTQINVRFETEDGKRIHTFRIMVDVEPTASSDTESTDWGELNSIGDMKAAITAMFEETMSVEAKQALLNLLAHVAYTDEHGQDYYDELEAELFRTAEIVSISAVFDQGSAAIYDTDDLDALRQYLTVTATYEDLSEREVTGYTLSGTLTEGTSTITASYGDKTTTFTVFVTAGAQNVYADDMENWFLTTSPNAQASCSDGVISLKSKNSTGATGYSTFAFDRAKTLWSAVEGKTLRCKIKLRSSDWQGEWATGSNSIALGLAIYKNASTSSGSDRLRNINFFANRTQVPTSEYETIEETFVASLSNFTSGTGTPTSSSTFGFFVYNASTNTIQITDAEIYEVTS